MDPSAPRKGLRLAGHPLHAMVVHYPVALWSISSLWDLLALWDGDRFWWRMSFWCLAAGLAAAVPAYLSGLVDFAGLRKNDPAEGEGTRHMLLMLAAGGFYGTSLLFRFGDAVPIGGQRILAIGLSGVGLGLLAFGGWSGGELAFRFGVGGSGDQRSGAAATEERKAGDGNGASNNREGRGE